MVVHGTLGFRERVTRVPSKNQTKLVEKNHNQRRHSYVRFAR